MREVQSATNKLIIKEAKLAYYTYVGTKISDDKIRQTHFWTAYKQIANYVKNTNIHTIIDNGVFENQCVINYAEV